MKQHLLLSLFISAGLVACGGSGSSSSTNNQAPTSSSSLAAKTANVAQGNVTGFGSVIVNGVHFDVKDAAINIDGVPGVESDLAVGQTVSLTGTVDDDGVRGKATKLSAETKIRGPIESIDLIKGALVVLGQEIFINGDTFYEDGVSAQNLKVGDVVKVSTHLNSDSVLIASRIEIKTGTEAKDLLISGAVANLDTIAMTFTINGTKVDYSNATIADLPNKTLKEGMLIRVHGTVVKGVFVVNGNVHSSALDLKHDDELDTKAKVELGGLISKLNIPAEEMLLGPTFVLGNTTVFFTKGIKIEGGTLLDLANGVRVRVAGKFDADRNVNAEKITLILKAKVDEEGLVQATDLTKNTLTLNGVTFEITADTSVNDRSKTHVRLFSLKDLVTGDYVNVRGYKIAATSSTPEHLVATRVERKNLSEKGKEAFKTEISGKIESVTQDAIKVSGHSIRITSATTITGFTSVDAFLKVAVGLNVEINGVIENDVFIARTIRTEIDDESEHSLSSASSSTTSSTSSVSSTSTTSSSVSSSVNSSSSVSSESTSSVASSASSAASSSNGSVI